METTVKIREVGTDTYGYNVIHWVANRTNDVYNILDVTWLKIQLIL